MFLFKIAVLLLSNLSVILVKMHPLTMHKITAEVHNNHILTFTFSGSPFGLTVPYSSSDQHFLRKLGDEKIFM
jgi:hypothetical protein